MSIFNRGLSIQKPVVVTGLVFCFTLFFSTSSLANDSHSSLMNFFESVYAQQLKDSPEDATSNDHHEYDDRWNDYSKAARLEHQAHLKQWLSEASKFDHVDLNDEDKLSLRLFEDSMRSSIAASDLEQHLLAVGQMYGLHNSFYGVIDLMPAHTTKDYENIIARIRGAGTYIDQYVDLLNESIARGITQPKIVVDLVAKQLDTQISQSADQSELLAAFRHFPESISESDRVRLSTAAINSYNQQFIPAWKKYRDFINGPYRAHARPTIGLSSIPQGDAAYRVMINRLTTTNISPAEIHKIGEQEVTRIESEMLKIAQQTGFQGSLTEFGDLLQNDPKLRFNSREEMLTNARDIAKRIEPQLPNLFKTIPRILFGVRPIPSDRESATATNAQPAAADGSAPGWFNLNTFEPDKQVRFDQEALVLHEALPGHIFQIGLAHNLGELPEFRRYYDNSAYVEGWALYSESLGSQLGLYQDPISRYGQLSSERFRAVRLVMDTGIHSMGWTREQAVEYFKVHAPENSYFEIDRYISWPGQALAYKLGQLEIVRLKNDVQKAQGDAFDIREFHDVILKDGVLPLNLLHERVQEHYQIKH